MGRWGHIVRREGEDGSIMSTRKIFTRVNSAQRDEVTSCGHSHPHCPSLVCLLSLARLGLLSHYLYRLSLCITVAHLIMGEKQHTVGEDAGCTPVADVNAGGRRGGGARAGAKT